MRFPLPFVPKRSYKDTGSGFGASRENVRKGLRHAANDLVGPPGTPVLAMEGGVVLRGPYGFFRGTMALEIQHSQFIARYCELDARTEVKAGDQVMEGQVIGYIGNQPGLDMLHMEFFKGTLNGDLTDKRYPPYERRKDVFNGSEVLDHTIHTVTHWDARNIYRYAMDAEGRKFVERMDLRDI